MLTLNTILELGKTFSAKSEKDDDKTDIVRAHIKFTAMAVDRDSCDELIGTVPVGWTTSYLFDDMGVPVAPLTLSLDGLALRVSGVIAGANDQAKLALVQADLTDITITLVKLGALVSGALAWTAKGDEVEDVTDLLGKTCKVEVSVFGDEQQDLLRDAARRFVDNAKRMGGVTISDSNGMKIEIPGEEATA